MIDSKDPVTIVPTIMSGKVKIYVSFKEMEDAFAGEEGGSIPLKIIGDNL